MERIETDIVVAGGGVAGLTATIALARAGFSCICIDATPPAAHVSDTGADLRSTAFLTPSIALFEEIGLWPRLAPFGADLNVMRLADAGGRDSGIRTTADFRAEEAGQQRFGVNLPNWLLRREMAAQLAETPGARLISPAAVTAVTPRLGDVVVRLSTGESLTARLLVAADGRDSFVRQTLDLPSRRWSYGQKAVVFAVTHPEPHDNISTEIHRTGGPFTLVPLPGVDGRHASAVVWMDTGPCIAALSALDDAAFATEATARSCGVLGPLQLASGRAVWPIISQIAHRLGGPRTALIAEAAHVVPPIGAQGLNMSLADIRVLRDLVVEARNAGQDIAAPALLTRYHRARHPDILTRVMGIDTLNRAAMAEPQPLRDLRRLGLSILAGTPPLRRAAMRQGLGLPSQ